jgi:hypothetical protein
MAVQWYLGIANDSPHTPQSALTLENRWAGVKSLRVSLQRLRQKNLVEGWLQLRASLLAPTFRAWRKRQALS